jgi:hypothetical protein
MRMCMCVRVSRVWSRIQDDDRNQKKNKSGMETKATRTLHTAGMQEWKGVGVYVRLSKSRKRGRHGGFMLLLF